MTTYDIKAWTREYKKEKKEHPMLPAWAVKQVVKDHFAKKK